MKVVQNMMVLEEENTQKGLKVVESQEVIIEESELSKEQQEQLMLLEMHELARKHRGKCLSTRFVDKERPLRWQCKARHKWYETPEKIKKGKWCERCVENKKNAERNERLRELQLIAAKKGGKCISDEYVDNKTHLVFECGAEQPHWWLALPKNIKDNRWCPDCYEIKKQQKKEEAKNKKGK